MNEFRSTSQDSTQGADRRRSPRQLFDGAIEVTTQSGVVIAGIAIDISNHGIAAIVYDDTLAVDDTVSIRFADPADSERMITREAVVRARSDHHCGFEFLLAARSTSAA